MGEGVGQGVGVGRRVILVFFGVLRGKRGAGGFFRFWIFFRGWLCGWAGFCVGVCEKGGCPPDVRVVWRCRCEAGVHCVACMMSICSCCVRGMWWKAQAGRGWSLERP